MSRRKQFEPQHILNDGNDESGTIKACQSRPSHISAEITDQSVSIGVTTPASYSTNGQHNVKQAVRNKSHISGPNLAIQNNPSKDNAYVVWSRDVGKEHKLNSQYPTIDRMDQSVCDEETTGIEESELNDSAITSLANILPQPNLLPANVGQYCDPADLEYHLRVHSGEQHFTCQHCSKHFTAKRSLQHHCYIHHGIEAESGNDNLHIDKNGTEEEDSQFKLLNTNINEEINVTVDSRSPLFEAYRNYNNVEKNDENGNEKILPDVKELKNMMLYNVTNDYNSSKFNGDQDEKNSGRNQSLAMALLEDTELYDVDSSMQQGNQLQRHILVHRKVKKYVCKVCSKQFNTGNRLREHKKLVHDMEFGPHQRLKYLLKRYTKGQKHTLKKNMPQVSKKKSLYFSEEIPKQLDISKTESGILYMQRKDIEDGETGGENAETSTSSDRKKSPPKNDKEAESSSKHEENVHDNSEESENNDFSVDFPSQFPGGKHQITIKNETVLVTRMDGVNINSGAKVSLYKCHQCGKVFNFLSNLQCHLSLHFERHITLYQCSLCGSNFKFRLQLFSHFQQNHGNKKVFKLDESTFQPLTPAGDLVSNKSDTPESNITSSAQKETLSTLERTVRVQQNLDGDGHTESVKVPSHMVGSPLQHYYIRRFKRAYVCRYCNKTFLRFFSLQRHERVHTRFKSCYCSECGKGFSESRSLRHHMVSGHKDQDQSRKVKHVRRTILSGLSRTTQRLTPVMSVEKDLVSQEAYAIIW
jgi:stress-induced morphogen